MRTLDELTVVRVDQGGPGDADEFTYIDIGSVDNLSKKIVGPKRVATSVAPSRAKQTLRAGDVIVSMTRPNLNAVALVPPALDGAIGSSGFHVLRAHAGVLPEWLYFGVQTRRFIDAMSDVVQGALYPAVRPRDIRAFSLPVPSVSAQRNVIDDIETQFSRLEEALANLQRVKANLRRFVSGVLSEAVSGALTASSKADWQTATVADVGDVLLGRRRAPEYATGAHLRSYLRVANIKDDFIAFDDLESMRFDDRHLERYELAPGDILVSEGQSPEKLGQSAIFRGYPQPLCFQSTLHRFRANPALTSPEFAQIVFRSHVRSGVFRKLGSITTNIGHLTLEKFKVAPFPLPPLGEQQKIVAEVERRLSIARGVEAQVEANLKRAQSLRQAVLDKAFAVEA